MSSSGWQVYCLRLATRTMASSRMLSATSGDIDIVYVMWCLKKDGKVVLIDTGLSEQAGHERGLADLRTPDIALRELSIDATDVESVVGTHLHGDHFSATGFYPGANFTIQKDDLDFFSGELATYPSLVRASCDMRDLRVLQKERRLELVSGDVPYADGISLVKVGGHTPGSQVVVVDSATAGKVVICGDAADLYKSIQLEEPAPTSTNRIEAVVGLRRISGMIGNDQRRIFPGHDPLLFEHATQVADGVYRMA